MKLIEASRAKETAQTLFTDPVLQWAVKTVLDNTPRMEIVKCKDCKYFLRHTKVNTDKGDCACYGIGNCRVKHIDDYCSKGRKESQ